MKFLKKDRRAYAAKASALKRLLGSGMLLEGSLTRSMRGGSEHCQLTDKADGRTRTLYVPARHADEVTASMALWKQARQALKGLSAAAREAYANAFAGQGGGARRGRPKGGSAKGAAKSPSRGRPSRPSAPKAARSIPADAPASARPRSRTSRRR
jgi:hypothetical protein